MSKQLQFFDRKTKRYAPSAHQGDLTPESARMVACGRPWRIADSERPLKPIYCAPIYRASTYTVDAIQARYCNWARSQGLELITAFENHWSRAIEDFIRSGAGTVRSVDPKEWLSVTDLEVQS